MGGKKLVFVIVSLFIVFSLGAISSEYNLGSPNHSIQTTYEPGAGIIGWISIQFTNESNSTMFKDSIGNSMTLIELINENPDFSYSVNTTYGTIDSAITQHLNLDSDIFKVLNTLGQKNYQFNFSNQEIFSEQINISIATTDLSVILLDKMEKINNLKEQINTFDLFEQSSINSALNISYLDSELARISAAYLIASTQTELENLSVQLALINIPNRIDITKTAVSLPIFPSLENINLDVIQNITNSTYESNKTSDYENAIIGWNVNNLNTKISFKEFSANYDIYSESLVNTFDLEITKKDVINYSAYIFLKKMNNLLFKQDYKEKEQGDYYLFDLIGDTKILSFSTTQNVNFTNLNFFISPALTKLSVTDFDYVEGKKDEEKRFEQKKWMIFTLVILLVLILGFILYLVLQTWYKKRYEVYLFPNRNDLYNLAIYITKSKKRGLDNDQVQESLKKSKWNNEQIRYALKKYSGKRTGMYEISLKKKLDAKEQTGSQGYGYRRYA